MNRYNRPGISQFREDQNAPSNQPLAPIPLMVPENYGLPLPYVIAQKTRGPRIGAFQLLDASMPY
jgi:hypothetical protein